MKPITFTFFMLCGIQVPRKSLSCSKSHDLNLFALGSTSSIDSASSASTSSKTEGLVAKRHSVVYLALLTKKRQAEGINFQAGKKTILGEKDAIPHCTGCSTEELKILPCAQALAYMCDVTEREVTRTSAIS